MRKKYDNWVKKFIESWKELDYRKALVTLDKNVKYYEKPIDKACKNFKQWGFIKEEIE